MESLVSGLQNASLTSLGTNSTGMSQVSSVLNDERPSRMSGFTGGVTERDYLRRRREFKGRHIQMMGLGKFFPICFNI